MTAGGQSTPWGALAERLVELVHAQQQALCDGDVELFARLVAERGPVQEALMHYASRVSLQEDPGALGYLLEQVAAVDRASFAAARHLMAEVSGELNQMRKGRSALHGYGHNGAGVSTLLLDQLG